MSANFAGSYCSGPDILNWKSAKGGSLLFTQYHQDIANYGESGQPVFLLGANGEWIGQLSTRRYRIPGLFYATDVISPSEDNQRTCSPYIYHSWNDPALRLMIGGNGTNTPRLYGAFYNCPGNFSAIGDTRSSLHYLKYHWVGTSTNNPNLMIALSSITNMQNHRTAGLFFGEVYGTAIIYTAGSLH